MNILLLNWRDVTHPKSGGAELVTMEHAKGWVKTGHTVTWLTGWYDGAKDEEIVDGVNIIRKAGSLTIYLYTIWYLIIHRTTFDVVIDEAHGFPFFSPIFIKTPVVLFIHEIAGEIWDYMFPFPKNVIGKLLESLYFRLYKHCYIWTDAQSTIEELVERGISRDHCVAIPCPIIVDKRLMMNEISKNKEPTYIFVSRVVRMKGIEEVIKTFSFIIKEQPNAQLWIVGDGEKYYVEELKNMIREYDIHNNAVFLGAVSEEMKYEYMSQAHILLHASVKEGWGLVVLEAASVGTPAVVYNVAGLKDVVKNDVTGIVIQNNSPQEMARDAIRLYIDKKRYIQYQRNGIKWANSLKWEDSIKKSEALLIKAIKHSGSL